jgi:hypothetical protein
MSGAINSSYRNACSDSGLDLSISTQPPKSTPEFSNACLTSCDIKPQCVRVPAIESPSGVTEPSINL